MDQKNRSIKKKNPKKSIIVLVHHCSGPCYFWSICVRLFFELVHFQTHSELSVPHVGGASRLICGPGRPIPSFLPTQAVVKILDKYKKTPHMCRTRKIGQCFRDPKIGRSSSGRKKKKKKKLPDEVRPDEVHPGSGKNGWGEGPGYIVKWTRWGAAPQGTHPTPYRKIKASPLWRRADLRPHLWYPPLSFPWHPLSPVLKTLRWLVCQPVCVWFARNALRIRYTQRYA